MPRPERPPLPIAPPNELRRDPSLRSLRPAFNAANGWRGAAIAAVAVAVIYLWADYGASLGLWAPLLLAQILGFVAGGLERRQR